MKYFRITGYCEEHDFSFIVDACGKFEKLWQFNSFLVLKNLKVLEVCESDKIQSSNIETPTEDKKRFVPAVKANPQSPPKTIKKQSQLPTKHM